MADKTEVSRVVFNDGSNHNALVFQKPVEGKSYHAGEMIVFGTEGQSSFAPCNDEGDIPHREGDTDLGEERTEDAEGRGEKTKVAASQRGT
jgi:hypothetical protein